jgi:hydroxymethylglutaryl-CoA reductase
LNWPGSPDPKPSELIKLRDKTVEERRAILNCPPLDTVGTPFLFAGLANVAALPIGVIPNVRLNGELRHLPYMVEEPSIGAAAANAAKDSECDATVTSLSDQYQIEATVTVKMKDEGEISKFMAAYLFADKVTKRAITNNKGFFNGTDPVLLAAGIDPSYIAYSAYQCVLDRGDCKPIVTWSRNSTGIEGRVGIAIPKASVQSSSFGHHSLAIRSIAGYQSVEDLVGAAITAGILNNKSAIKALAGKGINEGHMPLHNRSVLEH